jgi:hypothetical protein
MERKLYVADRGRSGDGGVGAMKNAISVRHLTTNLEATDIIVLSAAGEVRQQIPMRWYQRLWHSIDLRMRLWS